MKKKMRLRPYVLPTVYLTIVLILMGFVYYSGLTHGSYSNEEKDLRYVTTLDLLDTIEVSKIEEKMLRPYIEENVTIGKSFYDYKDNQLKQENSIVYYEGTYIQNSGVDYVFKDIFDVVSCLDGIVINVEKTELMGYIVEVKYDNDIIISYQSLSEVNVKKDDQVIKGQILGKSGKSVIGSELGNHLHLEMYFDGQIINPEQYYDKDIKDIK